MNLELSTVVNGRRWNLHSVDFTTADGKFSAYIYAISDEHACAIVQELRETATWGGQVMGVYSADGDSND